MKINPICQKAYKCVIVREGLRTSWSASIYNLGASVNYKKNKLIRAKIGNLMVFDSLDNAKAFYEDTISSFLFLKGEIWEVKAFKAKRINKLLKSFLFLNTIIDFWKPKRKPINGPDLMDVPSGTLSCKSLRLVKRVQ